MKNILLMLAGACLLTSASAEAQLRDVAHRVTLARAIAEKRSHTALLLVSKTGRAVELKRHLENIGVEIGYSNLSIGYFRVISPLNAVTQLSSHPTVQASALSSIKPELYETENETDADEKTARKETLSFTDYLRLTQQDKNLDWREAMGIRTLWDKHPTYDGRGTTIAVLENFPDPFQSEFSHARDLQGRRIPKFLEMRGYYNPRPDDVQFDFYYNEGLVEFSHYSTEEPVLKLPNDRRIELPFTGDFLLGYLNTTYLTRQAKLNDKLKSIAETFQFIVVARQRNSSCVYVDTNGNNDLRDEKCLADFNVRPEQSSLRAPSGEPLGMPFYVVPTQNNNRIVLASMNSHTHGILTTLAASQLWQKHLGGAAPSAQILVYSTGLRSDEVIESLIAAGEDPRVDVILTMTGIGHPSTRTDTLYSIVADRVATTYNKVMIAPAGNSQKMHSSISEVAGPTKTLAVGLFYPSARYALLSGRKLVTPVNISSAGPLADGALKPDVIAPSLAVYPIPNYIDRSREPKSYLCLNIFLPETVKCGSGTSHASPAAAGAAALLISAAKQENLPIGADDVIFALQASAQFFPSEKAHHQGRGAIDVVSALKYLRTLSNSKKKFSSIEVKAPVKTAFSAHLASPHEGVGLFEAEGWRAGLVQSRHITLTRRTGPKKVLTFLIHLIGDQTNTYSVPPKIRLPLNQPIKVPIEIRAREHGLHSAILRITDPLTGVPAKDISLAIVVPLNPNPGTVNQFNLSGNVSGGNILEFFVDVPDDAKLLHVREFSSGHDRVYFRSPLGAFNEPKHAEPPHMRADQESVVQSVSALQFAPSRGLWTIRFLNIKQIPEDKKLQTTLDIIPSLNAKTFIPASTMSHASQLKEPMTFNWRKTKGHIYNGSVQLRPGGLPQTVNINVPASARQIDGIFRLRSGKTRNDLQVLVTPFQCNLHHCVAMDFAGGKGQFGFLVTREGGQKWSKNWSIAFDSIGPSHRSVDLEYSIFVSVDNNDIAVRTGLPIDKTAGTQIHQGDAASACLPDDLVEAVELINPTVTQPIFRQRKVTDRISDLLITGRSIPPLFRQITACRPTTTDAPTR